MNLKQIAIKNIFFTSFGNILSQIIQFFTKIILARLLIPEDFGLMATMLITISILNTFFNFGWDTELIQRKINIKRVLNSIFSMFIIISILMSIMIFFSASIISYFFSEPRLISMIRLYSIIFITNSINIAYSAYAQKKLLFSRKVVCELVSIILFSLISIILAYLHFGVWSLLIAQLLQSISLTLLLFMLIKWRPFFNIDLFMLKHVWKFVRNSAILEIFGLLILQIDKIVVVKFLGIEKLGFYSMAFSFAMILLLAITNPISSIMYPLFSLSKNKAQQKKLFINSLQLNFFLLLPAMSFGFVFTDLFVQFFLSTKWIPIINIFRILLIYSLFRSVFNISSYIILSRSRPDVLKKILGIEFFLLFVFIIPSVKLFNINGVLFIVIISRIIATLIALSYIKKTLLISFKEYVNTFFMSLIISIFLLLIIFILKNVLFLKINLINFVLLLLLSFTLWIFLVLFFDKKSVKEIYYLINILREKFSLKIFNLF